MGQKVHPYGFRLIYQKNWHSKWFSKRDYASLLHEDIKLRRELKKQLHSLNAMVSKIDIERAADKVTVRIFTARPGIVIGRKGQEIEKIKDELAKLTGKEILLDIQEVKKPEIEAQLVAENVALQLERRIAFRRAMRKAEEAAIRFGAKGFKIKVAGRLNGAEIARTEDYLSGQMPLQTIRVGVDYGFAEAHTTYGIIGIKVWVNLGDQVAETVKR